MLFQASAFLGMLKSQHEDSAQAHPMDTLNKFVNTAKAGGLLLLATAVFACSPKPTTLVNYEKNGVAFSYASDWKVASDDVIDQSSNTRAIYLDGANGSMVSLVTMPVGVHMTLDAFAAEIATERVNAINSMLSVGAVNAGTANVGSSQAVTGLVGGKQLAGIVQRFNITVLGKSVPHESQFFAVTNERTKAFIMTQVATEHAKQAAPGIATALSSFRLAESK